MLKKIWWDSLCTLLDGLSGLKHFLQELMNPPASESGFIVDEILNTAINSTSDGTGRDFPWPESEDAQGSQVDFERIEIEGIAAPIRSGSLFVMYRQDCQFIVYVSDTLRFTTHENRIIDARNAHWNCKLDYLYRQVAIHGIQYNHRTPNDAALFTIPHYDDLSDAEKEKIEKARADGILITIDISTVTACPDCGGDVRQLKNAKEVSHYCLDCDWDDLEGGRF